MEVKEKRPLCHDGGRLLKWTIERLGIPREDWMHTYCYGGANKKQIPTIKSERNAALKDHIERLIGVVKLNMPCTIIGMGKLSSEVLTGNSVFKRKVGTYWEPDLIAMQKLGIAKLWITQSPDAALFNPEYLVSISRILCIAAEESGIPIEINYELKMFDFSKYQ